MDTKLQIIELLLALMDKEPNRYIIEVTSKGIVLKEYAYGLGVIKYRSYFYAPAEEYQYECNKDFEELIGGLRK